MRFFGGGAGLLFPAPLFFAAVIRKGVVNGYQVSSINWVGMMSEWLLALLQSMV